MYVAISPQQMGSTYESSVGDYVAYLGKENAEKDVLSKEHFFNQYSDEITPEKVIQEIDGNTAKLKKKEPKFYSLILSPSQRELRAIGNDTSLLKKYVREAMKDYANAFYRDKPVSVDDIKYFAKIEHERTYRGFEKEIKENAPFRKEIVKLENDIRKVMRGELRGNVKQLKACIADLHKQAPHKVNGKLLTVGMKKEGLQTHVHIIVSRKDASNTFSLSPGSKYKASEAVLHGKTVIRGFNRVQFFESAEKTFDNITGYKRNYVETFAAKKAFIQDTKGFYTKLLGLPTNERALAFKMLGKSGMKLPNVPTNKVQLAIKTFKKLKRGLDLAAKSASIGV